LKVALKTIKQTNKNFERLFNSQYFIFIKNFLIFSV